MSENNKITKCLECHADITLDQDIQAGEVVACPECSTDFEIIEANPVKIEKAPEAQEDWGQ